MATSILAGAFEAQGASNLKVSVRLLQTRSRGMRPARGHGTRKGAWHPQGVPLLYDARTASDRV